LIERFPKIITGDADLCFFVLADLARVLVDFQKQAAQKLQSTAIKYTIKLFTDSTLSGVGQFISQQTKTKC
jgi:hypothetical protein